MSTSAPLITSSADRLPPHRRLELLEQRNARKVQVTFLPWIKRVEAFLSAMLPRPQYVKLNVDALLRGDTKTRYESYAIGIDKGFLTVNESRAFEERAPLADPPPST